MTKEAQPLASGRLIAGRYRLEEAIGKGGTSVVWSATHLISTRRVALKFLSPEKINDEEAIARVYREARAASLPAHDGIVPIVDVFVSEGSPVLVMDLLEGESLRAKLDREQKLSEPDVIDLIAQVADAVSAAHAAGVVHRDLKPENIFLSKRAGLPTLARVLDFGIAKLAPLAEKSRSLTSTGALIGTPYYMAPEQAFGEREIDHRADIWSLGVVAYECLSGTRPTEAESFGQVLKILTHRDFVPLSRANPALSPSLTKVVDQMLQVDRGKRIATMEEVARRLRAASLTRPASSGRKVALVAVLVAAASCAAALGFRAIRLTPPTPVEKVQGSIELPAVSALPALGPTPPLLSTTAEPPRVVSRPVPKPALSSARSAEPRRPGTIVSAPPF